jgi:hypothetical protein
MKWSDVTDLRWKDLRKLSRVDRDGVLHRLGLEQHTPQSDFFASLGVFAVGVLVGAGLGLMFAPRPGTEIRSQLGQRIKNRGRAPEDDLQQGPSADSGTAVGSTRIGDPGRDQVKRS